MQDALLVFGASVRGPGHVRAGLPNQDAYLMFADGPVGGIVLADGLGSCIRSDTGAKAVCCSTMAAMRNRDVAQPFDEDAFLEEIKRGFCVGIDQDAYPDYMATCLWAFLPGDGKLHFGMIGDGLLAVLTRDGVVVKLSDRKTNSFSNVVSAISPKITSRDWQVSCLAEDMFLAAVLCTDGISDDLEDPDGFVRAFVAEYASIPDPDSSIATMLRDWPVPKHTDDKSVVCMARRGS